MSEIALEIHWKYGGISRIIYADSSRWSVASQCNSYCELMELIGSTELFFSGSIAPSAIHRSIVSLELGILH